MTGRGTPVAAGIEAPDGKRPTAQDAPPPDDFDEVSQRRWREILGEWPPGHFRHSDLSLLATLIRSEAMILGLDRMLADEGLVLQDSQGKSYSHPAVSQKSKLMSIVMSIQRGLRLAPSTRMRAESSALRKRAPARPWEA